jgi:hypothetical protein
MYKLDDNLSEEEFDKRFHAIMECRANSIGLLRRVVKNKKSTEKLIQTIEASSGVIYQIH